MKRQATQWEKIFENHIFDNFVSKLCRYKELLQCNKKNIRNGKDLNVIPSNTYE